MSPDPFAPARWSGRTGKKSVQAVPRDRRSAPSAAPADEPDGYMKAKAAIEAEIIPDPEPTSDNDAPSEKWTRAQLEEHAQKIGIESTGVSAYPTKGALLKAILEADAE